MTQEQYALNLIWLKGLAKGNPDVNIVLLGILQDFSNNIISFEEYLLKVKSYIQ